MKPTKNERRVRFSSFSCRRRQATQRAALAASSNSSFSGRIAASVFARYFEKRFRPYPTAQSRFALKYSSGVFGIGAFLFNEMSGKTTLSRDFLDNSLKN